VAGKNAIVRLGSSTGTPVEQATNTFTNVEGVTMTFTRAQTLGESPVTMTVAGDNAGTTANVQSFIDAYNKLKTVVDGMVASGDPAAGAAAGVFSHDSGVKVLQSRLVGMLRQAGTSSLAGFGITATRDGLLTLNAARLTRQLAVDPTGLDKLIGSSASTAKSGIAGNLDTYLEEWSGIDGQIIKRKDVNDKLQTQLAKRQDLLDSQYDRAYQRYLLQFTQLQTLQSQMSSNTSLFDALFGDQSN
jgi:flagellar hook-associated protein 2